MDYILRQSTASQKVLIGPFLLATDGSVVTSLTIANTDIEIYKAGSTTHVDKNSGGATHAAKGMYSMVFDATDTDTIGSGVAYVQVAGALPCKVAFTVLDEAVYDVLFGTTAPSTLAAGALMGLANDAITAAKIAADAGTEIAGAVTTALGTGSGLTALAMAADVASIAEIVDAIEAGSIGTALTAISSYLDTEIAAILAAVDTEVAAAVTQATEANAHAHAIDTRLPSDPADESALEAAVAGLATLIADVAVPGDAMTLTSSERTAIFGAAGDETLTFGQLIVICASALAGKLSGAPGGPFVVRNPADTKNVISMTSDANGNRSAVTLTP